MTDITAGHHDLHTFGRRTDVVDRIDISKQREGTVTAIDHYIGACTISNSAQTVGLSGYQIDCPRNRRPKSRLKKVVAHCEALRIVPQRSDGVAVVVAKIERSICGWPTTGRWWAGMSHCRRKQIHLPVVVRQLFLRVTV